MNWPDLFRATPRGHDWCGPPPEHTLGRATRADDSCAVCGTHMEPGEPPQEQGEPAWWRCPRCGMRYREATATLW
jgi:hypothetical protein